MRQGIETVPRDGKVVILEDDASGIYELAHWSPEERAWVGENGKPSTITPTYWHPLQRGKYSLPEGDEYLLQKECGSSPTELSERRFFPFSSGWAAPERPPAEDDGIAPRQVATAVVAVPVEAQTAPRESECGPPAWRRFVVSSIAAAMIAASLTGMYFRAQVAGYVMQYAGQHDIARIGTIGGQLSKRAIQLPVQESHQHADLLARAAALQPQPEADESSEQTAAWGALQVTETKTPKAIEPLEKKRRRADALENELAELRRSMEDHDLSLRASATTVAQSRKRDGERTAALMQDLAAARQELMANEVQYREALAEERDRSAALASGLATAQRNVETQLARSSKTENEAAKLKREADNATSELQQSLQRERERAEALASELATARREVDALAALSGRKSDKAARRNQTAEGATAKPRQSLHQERDKPEGLAPGAKSTRQVAAASSAEQLVSAEAKGNLEAAGLLARAHALLGQGNIGAARVVLERAAETGSAQATFALAETYDPLVLSTWRTYGTRGDATKARELYAKAYDFGIKAGKNRSDALLLLGREGGDSRVGKQTEFER